jgi:hypothetical protein
MWIDRFSVLAAVAMLAALLVSPLQAQQYDPVFDFIPSGGRSLLAQVLDSKPPATEVSALLTGKRSREEWVAYLKSRAGAIPVLKTFDERQISTLADYLSINAPLPAAKAPGEVTKSLPKDGRDIALDYCQSCHIITVTVTQDRTREHWLGTMNKPSHVGIKLTPQERDALARYLVLNAGIPIDQVPEDLRAGGASY